MRTKIYIAGIEEEGSGWKWFFDEKKRDEQFNLYKSLINASGVAYKGECFIEGKNLCNDDITELVEIYLEENEFEKTFGFITFSL